ncbi:hypothetical protein GCM10028816_12840 [Spirosoma lituiforme]
MKPRRVQGLYGVAVSFSSWFLTQITGNNCNVCKNTVSISQSRLRGEDKDYLYLFNFLWNEYE